MPAESGPSVSPIIDSSVSSGSTNTLLFGSAIDDLFREEAEDLDFAAAETSMVSKDDELFSAVADSTLR